MSARIRFIVEHSGFFESHFLAKEGFVDRDRFVAMFGLVGLAEAANKFAPEGKKYGSDAEANEVAEQIMDAITAFVNAYECPYCEIANHRLLLHAQVGIDSDHGITSGIRIPVGDEPESIYDHLRHSSRFHRYIPTGCSDILPFDITGKQNPAAILDIVKGAFSLGQKYIAFYASDSDLVRITGYLVDMLNEGCFESLMDVQCFDLKAVESIRDDPRHCEISATHYASPGAKSAVVDSLDVVILGATQIDTDFNINVHTDSNGRIMGGSGGHSDTAAGAKLSMIIAPLSRARLPIVTDRVTCISTPGSTIDVLVTQKGVAVNPKDAELRQRLIDAKINVLDIRELKEMAERTSGVPEKPAIGDRIVADVIYRDGTVIDRIREVRED